MKARQYYQYFLPIRLHEILEEAPPNKQVKYSEVHERLHNRFDVSTVHTTKILRAAFPLAEKKRSGREKHCYYTGITWKSFPLSSLHCTTQSPSQSPTQPSSQPSTSLVPQSSLETPSVGELLERNRTLERQIRDLEEKIESQQAVISHHQLQQEVAFPVHSQGQVIHGREKTDHFRSFSLEQVSNEVQCGAPMLYELMQTLGDTRRNVEDDGGMTGRNESTDVLLHSAQCSVTKCKWNPTAPEFYAGDPWYY